MVFVSWDVGVVTCEIIGWSGYPGLCILTVP